MDLEMNSFFKHFLIVPYLVAFFYVTNAIQCYQCGTESNFVDYQYSEVPEARRDELENTLLTIESCSNLEFSFSSWGPYAVNCAPDHICSKTIVDDGYDEKGWHRYVTSSRGCAMRNTSQGAVHLMGCGIMKSNIPPAEIFQEKMDIVCYCDEDYCNGTPKIIGSLPLLILLYSLGLKLVYRLILW